MKLRKHNDFAAFLSFSHVLMLESGYKSCTHKVCPKTTDSCSNKKQPESACLHQSNILVKITGYPYCLVNKIPESGFTPKFNGIKLG